MVINIERVNTSVIQVVYSVDPEHPHVKERKVLVSQRLDVFIDVR